MSLGFWSSLAMFAFAITGIGLHYQTGKLLDLLNGADTAIALPGHGPTIEGMLQTGREALPGAAIPRLLLSEKAGDPVFLYMRFPEDKTPAGRSFVTLNPKTGAVLSVGNSRNAPVMKAALVQYTREIHTGTLWGIPTRILAALFGFTLSILAITGPLIWITNNAPKPEAAKPSPQKLPQARSVCTAHQTPASAAHAQTPPHQTHPANSKCLSGSPAYCVARTPPSSSPATSPHRH